MHSIKKIFPFLFIVFGFAFFMVLQMYIEKKEVGASNVNKSESKYSVYEGLFHTLVVKTVKENKKVKLSEIKEPIVILNFWASWCLPCVSEFKALNKLIEIMPEHSLKVIGISNDDEKPRKTVLKTMNKHALMFDSVLDPESELTSKFLVSAIPATIVFHKGKVIHFVNKEFNFASKEFISKLKGYLKN